MLPGTHPPAPSAQKRWWVPDSCFAASRMTTKGKTLATRCILRGLFRRHTKNRMRFHQVPVGSDVPIDILEAVERFENASEKPNF